MTLEEQYGTEKGAAPALAHILAAALGLGVIHQDQMRVKDVMAKAALMDQMSREYESQKMQATIDALKLGSIAKEAGAELGRQVMEQTDNMDKEAIGALMALAGRGLGRGLGGVLSGAGKGVSALGRAGNTNRFLSQARRMGAAPAGASAGPLSGALRQTGVGLRQAGQRTTQAANKLQAPVKSTSKAVSAPASVAAPKSKPLIGAGTKMKLLGGAGLVGAGYAGLKGLQTARDYMMTPSGYSSYGNYGPRLMHGVSQYGYPTY